MVLLIECLPRSSSIKVHDYLDRSLQTKTTTTVSAPAVHGAIGWTCRLASTVDQHRTVLAGSSFSVRLRETKAGDICTGFNQGVGNTDLNLTRGGIQIST